MKKKRRGKADFGVKDVVVWVIIGGGAAIMLFLMGPFFNDVLPKYRDALSKASWSDFWPTGFWVTVGMVLMAIAGWVWLALAQSAHEKLKRHLFGWVADPPGKCKASSNLEFLRKRLSR